MLKPPKNAKTSRGPTSTYWMGKDDIIYCVADKGAEDTIETAKENFKAFKKMLKHDRHLFLCDIRGQKSMTREAREFYSSDEVAEVLIASAQITSSSISRVIANFYLGINKPSIPVRLFDTPEDGLVWLKNIEAVGPFKEIETRTATISLGNDDIIRNTSKKVDMRTLSDIKEILGVFDQLTKDKARPVLADITHMGPSTREAREYGANYKGNISAFAMVTKKWRRM